MTILRFVKELPVTKQGSRGPQVPFAALDARPGQWAAIRLYKRAQSCYPTATRLNSRLKAKGYEFAGRSDGNGGGVLYGRRIKK